MFLSPTPGHCSPSEQSVQNSVDTPGQSPDRPVSSVYNRAKYHIKHGNIKGQTPFTIKSNIYLWNPRKEKYYMYI